MLLPKKDTKAILALIFNSTGNKTNSYHKKRKMSRPKLFSSSNNYR
jgi:hypothetical protein